MLAAQYPLQHIAPMPVQSAYTGKHVGCGGSEELDEEEGGVVSLHLLAAQYPLQQIAPMPVQSA